MPSTFKKASLNSSETGPLEQVLYQVPSGVTAVGVGFTIANVLEVDLRVTVRVGGTTLVPNAPLRVGETMILTAQGQKVVIDQGETVQISCTVENGVEAYLSVMEQS